MAATLSATESLFVEPPSTSQFLVVGAGPTGLFAAYLLGKQGFSCTIVERRAKQLGQPKAHAINPRTLEIFRQAGLDVAKLRGLGASADDAFWVQFVSGLTGLHLGKLPYERQDEDVKKLTPEPLLNVSQTILEQFLQEAALDTGKVSIHRQWQWEDFRALEEDGTGGGSLVSNIRSTTPAEHVVRVTVQSHFIIGADGPDSAVRSSIAGITWDAPGGWETEKQYYMSTHLRGDLRSKVAPLDRPAQLYFCLHPEHPAGIIAYDLSSSFVHVAMIDNKDVVHLPGQQPELKAPPACMRKCLPNMEHTTLSQTLWFTWPRVASRYTSEDLRIFLAGDAAHAFPPQGGLGINTGIGDVHNLAWKLNLAMHGAVSSAQVLLESYTAERKPVAVANALQSAENERVFRGFVKEAAELVREAEAHGGAAWLEQEHIQARLAQLIAANKPHFDSLLLQLGYVYGESESANVGKNVWNYVPSRKGGARLPHAWLHRASSGVQESILDIVPYDSFVVLHKGGECWKYAARRSSGEKCLFLDVAELGADQNWQQVVFPCGQNAVLVRPDQHILGHVSSVHEVGQEIDRYLGRAV